MPTNTPISTESTGNVGTVAWANSVANLNTAVGLFGIGGVNAGSPPPVTAPNFLLQTGGALVVSLNNISVGTVYFPAAFPNGLVSVNISPANTSGNGFSQAGLLTKNASGFTFVGYTYAGASLANSNVVIDWIAVGF